MRTHDARLRRIDAQHRKAHVKQTQSIQVVYYDVDEHGVTHYTDAVTGERVDPSTVKPVAALRNIEMWRDLDNDPQSN